MPDILPDGLDEKCDLYIRVVVDFYRHWVADGCPDSYSHEYQPGHRLLVTRHREVPHPVVMYSHREWRPFEQRYCWTLSRPWGGVPRHPTELFVYMVSELFEETKKGGG